MVIRYRIYSSTTVKYVHNVFITIATTSYSEIYHPTTYPSPQLCSSELPQKHLVASIWNYYCLVHKFHSNPPQIPDMLLVLLWNNVPLPISPISTNIII